MGAPRDELARDLARELLHGQTRRGCWCVGPASYGPIDGASASNRGFECIRPACTRRRALIAEALG